MTEAPPNELPMPAEAAGHSTPIRLLAWAEVVVAALLTVVALVLAVFMSSLIGAGGIETAEDYLHLTPDAFPRLTMVLLAAVCARYAVGAARALPRSTERHDSDFLDALRRAAFMMVVAVCYAASISWLGFIASTMLVAAVISYFLGLRNPLAFLPGVLIVPIVVRFVFERWLFIALPRSEIEWIATSEDAVIGALLAVQKAVISVLNVVVDAVF